MKKVVKDPPPSVCVSVYLYARLTSNWKFQRILLMFGIWDFIGHGSVPGEYEYSSSKNRGFTQGSRDTIFTMFLKKRIKQFVLHFNYLLRPCLLIEMHRCHLQENNGTTSAFSIQALQRSLHVNYL
jgi:hypothetical protein